MNNEDQMISELSEREKRKMKRLFNERVEELQHRVLQLEPGQPRDLLIEFIKEYQSYWINGVLRTEKKKEPLYNERI